MDDLWHGRAARAALAGQAREYAVVEPGVAGPSPASVYPGVAVYGGTINGPVVDINTGTINYYTLAISGDGTRLGHGPAVPVTARARVLRLPRPLRVFYDREETLAALECELTAGGGAWLHGTPGCGLSAVLRQAANRPAAAGLPHGALYLDGALETDDPDELLRRLYVAYHECPIPLAVHPEAARTFLSERQALFVFVQLPLPHDTLAGLADTLRMSAVLIAAEGDAPSGLADVALDGLPRAEALRLPAATADAGEEGEVLERLCDALADTPLALVLAGRMLRARVASARQLAATAEALAAAIPRAGRRAGGRASAGRAAAGRGAACGAGARRGRVRGAGGTGAGGASRPGGAHRRKPLERGGGRGGAAPPDRPGTGAGRQRSVPGGAYQPPAHL